MGQRAVGVGLDDAIIISHGHMTPLIQWRHESRINPGPTWIAVGKGPLNAAVGKARNLVLTLSVDDNATVRSVRAAAGGKDPSTKSEPTAHHQIWSRTHLHVSVHT